MTMMREGTSLLRLLLFMAMALGLSAASGGCKKSSDGDAISISLPPNALNPDGSIKEEALKDIEAHSSDPRLQIASIRAPLSDAALAQLARFPNIRRVDAFGSRITDQGIAKLKQAIPDVEVNK